jgi:hypothetical protein
VVFHDVDEDRQQRGQRRAIVGGGQVSVQRLEEPQRGIGGVVEPFGLAFGEEIGNEPVAHVVAERPEDLAGLIVPAGDQGQPGQRDHGVTAPVGEPVIARDHRARVAAGRARVGGIGHAADRRHQERVGGQHQLGGDAVARGRLGHGQQPTTTRPLGGQRGRRRQRPERLPRLGGRHQRELVADGEVAAKVPGTPQVARRLVAAGRFHAVDHARDAGGVHGERASPNE